MAFASIRDKIRQQRNEQASRKLTHRLVVGPDTRRASNVLAMAATPGNNPATTATTNATTATTKSPVITGELAGASSASSGSGFGVEFVVADLTVTAQRLEQVGH